MSGPSKHTLAGHHLTEAIRHLYAAAEFVRELPDRKDVNDLALVVERAAETARDVRGEVEVDASQGIRGRAPKKSDRRGGERRASKRRLHDKSRAALRVKGSAR